MAAMRVGDGTEEGVEVGPLIEPRAIEKVERHVADAKAKGATVALDGTSEPSSRSAGPSSPCRGAAPVDGGRAVTPRVKARRRLGSGALTISSAPSATDLRASIPFASSRP